jgi:hypothetical protein
MGRFQIPNKNKLGGRIPEILAPIEKEEIINRIIAKG